MKQENEEVKRLERLIEEDNVEELSKILNFSVNLRTNFNTFFYSIYPQNGLGIEIPFLHLSLHAKSRKVLEYLLSQDFVDKTICNSKGENIYHSVCTIRGEIELFSLIERKVSHNLILNESFRSQNAFQIACENNNIFIVKRVYKILENLQVNLSPKIKRRVISCAMRNSDIDVIQFVLSTDLIQLNDEILFEAIRYLKFNIVVYLLNVYLWKSIPSHLHNQFHIFQFSNLHLYNNIINNTNNLNNYDYQDRILEDNRLIKEEKINKNEYCNNNNNLIDLNNNNNNLEELERNNNNNNNDYYYRKLVEENYKTILEINVIGNRIWHDVCNNRNFDVVQFIFSLKGIQPEIENDCGENAFLIACKNNPHLKIIKFLHKLFPSFIHSQINQNEKSKNGTYLVLRKFFLNRLDQLKILHYLYLNGINIHLLSKKIRQNQIIYKSIYSKYVKLNSRREIIKYVKIISEDFDYIHNEHDNEGYKKPSFWKEIDDNSDEHSKRVNEWKNRFEEHVIRKLSKMIQEYML